jgi:hypothetical protein
MKGKLLLLTCLLCGFQSLAQQDCTPPLGATLAPITWNYNPSNWFVDYMKMSKPGFGPEEGPWYPGQPTTDAEGWPTEPFSIWVKLGIYPQDTGVYHLEFEGFAELFVFGAHVITDQIYDATTHKTTARLHVVLTETQIALRFSAPMSAVVKHIKLIAPGFDPANHPTFHPDWVEHVSRFPVLRFMTWNAANYNTKQEWSERNRTDSPTQAYRSFPTQSPVPTPGVAWEYVSELANLTGADIWINIPVKASNDYVRQLAVFLKNTLQPGTKIYVEYANEVWNGNAYPFQQNWNATLAEVASGNSNLNDDGESNTQRLAWRRYARRSKEIGDIVAQEFGVNALFTRIFPVFGHQIVSPGSSINDALSFMKVQYGPPNQYFWAIAGAPFLNGNGLPQNGLTVDAYFQWMEQAKNRMFGSADNFLDAGLSYATYYDLHYMAHEAGTDTYFFGSQYPQALKDTIAMAQNDPRMKVLMEDYLGNWFRYGGRDGLYTWFVAGATDWRFGDTYGLVNDRLHLSNVKTQAIDKILSDECPKQQAGHPVPGTIDARKYVQYPANWADTPFNTAMFQGNSHQYLLDVADSCSYTCYLVAENAQFGAARFEVLLNDKILDTLVVPQISTAGFDTFLVGNIPLQEGLNTLRLRYLTWCYGTHALIFETGNGCITGSHSPTTQTFSLYPNPTQNGFFIQPDARVNDTETISVFDVLGRLVYQKTHVWAHNQPAFIDITLPQGYYRVKLGSSVKSLVVVK